MIRTTHKNNPQWTVSAYGDNAAVSNVIPLTACQKAIIHALLGHPLDWQSSHQLLKLQAPDLVTEKLN